MVYRSSSPWPLGREKKSEKLDDFAKKMYPGIVEIVCGYSSWSSSSWFGLSGSIIPAILSNFWTENWPRSERCLWGLLEHCRGSSSSSTAFTMCIPPRPSSLLQLLRTPVLLPVRRTALSPSRGLQPRSYPSIHSGACLVDYLVIDITWHMDYGLLG